jgi:hypothetical protein
MLPLTDRDLIGLTIAEHHLGMALGALPRLALKALRDIRTRLEMAHSDLGEMVAPEPEDTEPGDALASLDAELRAATHPKADPLPSERDRFHSVNPAVRPMGDGWYEATGVGAHGEREC